MGYQLPPANRIPELEYMLRLEAFFIAHKTEFVTITGAQVNEMFTLYNDRLTPREEGKSCSGCRGRVYRRLLAHFEYLKNKPEESNGTEEK